MGRHYLLCGAIDSGKSAAVLALATRLIARGSDIAGWITPAFLQQGRKAGHDFIAIERGRPSPPIPFTREAAFEGSFFWRRYHFHKAAFVRAAAIPLDADLFLLDEIGPLEIEERRGFASVARRAYEHCPATLTVLRSGLESSFAAFAADTAFIPVTAAGIMTGDLPS